MENMRKKACVVYCVNNLILFKQPANPKQSQSIRKSYHSLLLLTVKVRPYATYFCELFIFSPLRYK